MFFVRYNSHVLWEHRPIATCLGSCLMAFLRIHASQLELGGGDKSGWGILYARSQIPYQQIVPQTRMNRISWDLVNFRSGLLVTGVIISLRIVIMRIVAAANNIY